MNELERPVPADEAAIAGVITDDAGMPLPWAVVSLGGASPQHQDIGAVTDDEGRYRFDRLAPGVYTVLVSNPICWDQDERRLRFRYRSGLHWDVVGKGWTRYPPARHRKSSQNCGGDSVTG